MVEPSLFDATLIEQGHYFIIVHIRLGAEVTILNGLHHPFFLFFQSDIYLFIHRVLLVGLSFEHHIMIASVLSLRETEAMDTVPRLKHMSQIERIFKVDRIMANMVEGNGLGQGVGVGDDNVELVILERLDEPLPLLLRGTSVYDGRIYPSRH